MVRLNDIERGLGLSLTDPDVDLQTFARASGHFLSLPPTKWRPVFTRLLAQEVTLHLPVLKELTDDLSEAVRGSQPERRIVQWLAAVTGGRATIRSSWGDVIAQMGSPGQTTMEQRLVHDGRPVGSLTLEAEAHWLALCTLVTDYALLARLQSAAAGAARRRVGERQFEALLAGEIHGAPSGGTCLMAALRLATPVPRAVRAHEAYTHRLDVLCAVGEGYFQERSVTCLTTVRGDKALWLWQSKDADREIRGLHLALVQATEHDFRLGVSGTQPGYEGVGAAFRQALQALEEVRTSRGLTSFQQLDPLQILSEHSALQALAEQMRGQLHGDDGGKLEDTLRAYLNHQGTLNELAQSLNLHVNTLRYRLRQIEEKLGGTLTEPAFIARLYLAFQFAPQHRTP